MLYTQFIAFSKWYLVEYYFIAFYFLSSSVQIYNVWKKNADFENVKMFFFTLTIPVKLTCGHSNGSIIIIIQAQYEEHILYNKAQVAWFVSFFYQKLFIIVMLYFFVCGKMDVARCIHCINVQTWINQMWVNAWNKFWLNSNNNDNVTKRFFSC